MMHRATWTEHMPLVGGKKVMTKIKTERTQQGKKNSNKTNKPKDKKKSNKYGKYLWNHV